MKDVGATDDLQEFCRDTCPEFFELPPDVSLQVREVVAIFPVFAVEGIRMSSIQTPLPKGCSSLKVLCRPLISDKLISVKILKV